MPHADIAVTQDTNLERTLAYGTVVDPLSRRPVELIRDGLIECPVNHCIGDVDCDLKRGQVGGGATD